MYNTSLLQIDSPTAKEIGYTSDCFESGTIWKKLPLGFYITRLEPKSQEALKHMLDKIAEKGFLIKYTIPGLHQEYVKKTLDEYGYVTKTDPAGNIEYVNFTVSDEGKLQRTKTKTYLQKL